MRVLGRGAVTEFMQIGFSKYYGSCLAQGANNRRILVWNVIPIEEGAVGAGNTSNVNAVLYGNRHARQQSRPITTFQFSVNFCGVVNRLIRHNSDEGINFFVMALDIIKTRLRSLQGCHDIPLFKISRLKIAM